MAKPLKTGIALASVAAACGLFFLARMYRHDLIALKGFVGSYENFNGAMSDLAQDPSTERAGQAQAALSVLRTSAQMKISSLIKNEQEVMSQARRIADLAQKELAAWTSGGAGGDAGALAQERITAYGYFRMLSGDRTGTLVEMEY